jgi:hypothetical protein
VHALGRGAAYAWRAEGQVCLSVDAISGCVDATKFTTRPIAPIINDPDYVGSGEPARVLGLAIDGVAEVAVQLGGGTWVSAKPQENWFEVTLPSTAKPWDAQTAVVTMSSGNRVAFPLQGGPKGQP